MSAAIVPSRNTRFQTIDSVLIPLLSTGKRELIELVKAYLLTQNLFLGDCLLERHLSSITLPLEGAMLAASRTFAYITTSQGLMQTSAQGSAASAAAANALMPTGAAKLTGTAHEGCLFVGSSTGSVTVFNETTRAKVTEWQLPHPCLGIQCQGTRVMTLAGGELRLRDIANEGLLFSLPRIRAFHFEHHVRLYTVATTGVIALHDLRSGQLVRSFKPPLMDEFRTADGKTSNRTFGHEIFTTIFAQGDFVATGGCTHEQGGFGILRRWDCSTGVATHNAMDSNVEITEVQIAGDAVLAQPKQGPVKLYDAQLRCQGSLQLTDDSTMVLGGDRLFVRAKSGQITVFTQMDSIQTYISV